MYSVFYDYVEFILYLYFSYFSHPLLGGAGIRGIITPVYIICVFLQYILLCCCIYCCICSITSEHLLLYFSCQFQIPPHVCTVYRKRKLQKSIYINTMVPILFKHSLPLPERFHHNFLLLSTPLLYIQPAIKLRESNQAENE